MIVACKKPAETVLSTPDLGEFAKHRNFLSKADKVILYSTESSRSQGGADSKQFFMDTIFWDQSKFQIRNGSNKLP